MCQVLKDWVNNEPVAVEDVRWGSRTCEWYRLAAEGEGCCQWAGMRLLPWLIDVRPGPTTLHCKHWDTYLALVLIYQLFHCGGGLYLPTCHERVDPWGTVSFYPWDVGVIIIRAACCTTELTKDLLSVVPISTMIATIQPDRSWRHHRQMYRNNTKKICEKNDKASALWW